MTKEERRRFVGQCYVTLARIEDARSSLAQCAQIAKPSDVRILAEAMRELTKTLIDVIDCEP